jgi:hypothetical protein
MRRWRWAIFSPPFLPSSPLLSFSWPAEHAVGGVVFCRVACIYRCLGVSVCLYLRLAFGFGLLGAAPWNDTLHFLAVSCLDSWLRDGVYCIAFMFGSLQLSILFFLCKKKESCMKVVVS